MHIPHVCHLIRYSMAFRCRPASSSFLLLLQGEPFLDPQTSTARSVAAEYAAARGDTWSSKDMLQLIRRKSQVPQRLGTSQAGQSCRCASWVACRVTVAGSVALGMGRLALRDAAQSWLPMGCA